LAAWEVVDKSPAKARVSTALPVEMRCGSSFFFNRGPMQTVGSEDVQKHVVRTVEAIKETTEEFLLSLDLLFDIILYHTTKPPCSLISHNF